MSKKSASLVNAWKRDLGIDWDIISIQLLGDTPGCIRQVAADAGPPAHAAIRGSMPFADIASCFSFAENTAIWALEIGLFVDINKDRSNVHAMLSPIVLLLDEPFSNNGTTIKMRLEAPKKFKSLTLVDKNRRLVALVRPGVSLLFIIFYLAHKDCDFKNPKQSRIKYWFTDAHLLLVMFQLRQLLLVPLSDNSTVQDIVERSMFYNEIDCRKDRKCNDPGTQREHVSRQAYHKNCRAFNNIVSRARKNPAPIAPLTDTTTSKPDDVDDKTAHGSWTQRMLVQMREATRLWASRDKGVPWPLPDLLFTDKRINIPLKRWKRVMAASKDWIASSHSSSVCTGFDDSTALIQHYVHRDGTGATFIAMDTVLARFQIPVKSRSAQLTLIDKYITFLNQQNLAAPLLLRFLLQQVTCLPDEPFVEGTDAFRASITASRAAGDSIYVAHSPEALLLCLVYCTNYFEGIAYKDMLFNKGILASIYNSLYRNVSLIQYTSQPAADCKTAQPIAVVAQDDLFHRVLRICKAALPTFTFLNTPGLVDTMQHEIVDGGVVAPCVHTNKCDKDEKDDKDDMDEKDDKHDKDDKDDMDEKDDKDDKNVNDVDRSHLLWRDAPEWKLHRANSRALMDKEHFPTAIQFRNTKNVKDYAPKAGALLDPARLSAARARISFANGSKVDGSSIRTVIIGSIQDALQSNTGVLCKQIARNYCVHGPPGRGKTCMVEDVAMRVNLPLVNISTADLEGLTVGETEQRVHNLFLKLAAQQPIICFIDEAERAVGKRSDVNPCTADRITATFLSLMDPPSNQARHNCGVIIFMSATSSSAWTQRSAAALH